MFYVFLGAACTIMFTGILKAAGKGHKRENDGDGEEEKIDLLR